MANIQRSFCFILSANRLKQSKSDLAPKVLAMLLIDFSKLFPDYVSAYLRFLLYICKLLEELLLSCSVKLFNSLLVVPRDVASPSPPARSSKLCCSVDKDGDQE